MKLKTIKDCYMSDGRNYEQKLKEEAMKDVKQFQIISKDSSEDWDGWDSSYMDAIIDYIKHKFNITDKELNSLSNDKLKEGENGKL